MLSDLIIPDAILLDAWKRLEQASADAKHPFRTCGLATLDNAGAPALRTAVLRQVNQTTRHLFIHTDRRSSKHAQIQRDPRTALLFYDAVDALQLRIEAVATLHDADAIAIENWNALPPHSRELYETPLAPSSPMPHMFHGITGVKSDARQNFAVIGCAVQSIDWLYLNPNGHRRARFKWQGQTLKTEWLVP